MPGIAPTPYVFTSDTVRIISIDYSTFPTCSVNDGGTITSVSFTQLFNYVSQSDGDFFILDLSVNLEFIGYPNVRIYQHPENFMPLSALPSGYSYVNGVFTAPETSTGGTVDLNPIYTAINSAVDLIGGMISGKGDEIINHIPTFNTSSIQTSLETIKGYTDTLEGSLSTIETRLSSSPVLSSVSSSLNGDYYSFKDNDTVLCYPSDREYKVIKSYLSFATKSSLTILYDLVDSDGKKHTVPHEALSLKV